MAKRRNRPATGSRAGMQRGELTKAEVAKTAAVAGEGFTTRATGRGAGKPARDTLSTGFAPAEGRGAEVPIDPKGSAEEQIRTFNLNKLDILGGEGGPWAVGGWQDPETNEVQMDTSVLTPRTVGGLAAAMQMASESGQKAIGNLGKKRYEGDIDVPDYIQKDQFFPETTVVKDLGNIGAGGRKRISITPSRKEMINVEAEETAKKMGFPDDLAEKGLRLA
jgi:hypothetical protein